MTLLFDKNLSIDSPTLAPTHLREGDASDDTPASARIIEIALVNNMPDAALEATERQFMRLLRSAAGDKLVRLHCFSLPSVARSPQALSHIEGLYADIVDLQHMKIDGLIVTGAEPRTPSLREEPYWPALTELVDWAATHTTSTIWSCLAAHAAVLHLDGIERRRLDRKCSGLFDCVKDGDHWLLRDLNSPLRIAHSRLNGLVDTDLSSHGYQVLTSAADIGVDIFTKQTGSHFVFFQGHPEYDVLSLQREYLRDINRYLAGEQHTYPPMPANYFDGDTEAILDAFRERAMGERHAALMDRRPAMTLRADIATAPRQAAATIFRNWLQFLHDQSAG